MHLDEWKTFLRGFHKLCFFLFMTIPELREGGNTYLSISFYLLLPEPRMINADGHAVDSAILYIQ